MIGIRIHRSRRGNTDFTRCSDARFTLNWEVNTSERLRTTRADENHTVNINTKTAKYHVHVQTHCIHLATSPTDIFHLQICGVSVALLTNETKNPCAKELTRTRMIASDTRCFSGPTTVRIIINRLVHIIKYTRTLERKQYAQRSC